MEFIKCRPRPLVRLQRAQAPTICATYRGPYRVDALGVLNALVGCIGVYHDLRDDDTDGNYSLAGQRITHLVVRRLLDDLRFDKTTLDDDDHEVIRALLRCLQTMVYNYDRTKEPWAFQTEAIHEMASRRMLDAIERRVDTHDECLCLLLSILTLWAGFVGDDDAVTEFYVNVLRSPKIRNVLDGHIADETPRLVADAVDSDFTPEGECNYECLTTFADLSVEILTAGLFFGSPPTLHDCTNRTNQQRWTVDTAVEECPL